MSLAGIPPLSGFFAKFNLIKAGLIESQYLVVAVALLVSLFTLYSMIKIWNEAFWKLNPQKIDNSQVKLSKSMVLPIGFLAILTLFVGFAIGPVFNIALRAGVQLANPAQYIAAVFGGT
jgi:multicomponent Na+:H+ antiporter subunit D